MKIQGTTDNSLIMNKMFVLNNLNCENLTEMCQHAWYTQWVHV